MGKENKDIKKVNCYSPMGDIVGLIICLVINNNLHKWGIPFIDSAKWLIYLPYANIFTIVNSILNILGKAAPGRISNLFKMLDCGLGVVSMSYLLKFKPFDFSLMGYANIDNIFVWAVKIAMVVAGIAALVYFIRFIAGDFKIDTKPEK